MEWFSLTQKHLLVKAMLSQINSYCEKFFSSYGLKSTFI